MKPEPENTNQQEQRVSQQSMTEPFGTSFLRPNSPESQGKSVKKSGAFT